MIKSCIVGGAAAAALALLGGCQMIPGYEAAKAAVVGAGIGAIEERKQANDLQAGFVFASVCDLSVGAIGRTSNPLDKQYAIDKCMNGGGGATLTIDALGRIVEIMRPENGFPPAP